MCIRDRGALVTGQQGGEEALERPIQPVVRAGVAVPQIAAAQHRRQRERDQAGHQNRRADGDRELVQQPPDDAAHEHHRDKDGDQGQGHGDDGLSLIHI